MWKRLLATLIFSIPLCSTGAIAQNSTVLVSVINNSSRNFVFNHSAVVFQENSLSIDTPILYTGDTAVITGNTTFAADLLGSLFFNDDAIFRISDRRQFHMGSPTFAMSAPGVVSKVISREINPVKGPRLLLWVAAKILLSDANQTTPVKLML